jgi:hypothetical protein
MLIASFGWMVVDHQRELNARQLRVLNEDIERIVAERRERNRPFTTAVLAGLPTLASAERPGLADARLLAFESKLPPPLPEPRPEAAPQAETSGTATPAETATAAPPSNTVIKSVKTAARQQRPPKSPRVARGIERTLPNAFASLPKFVGGAGSLLGLR